MEIRHLRSFVAVAANGSISRAGKQLQLAQPAVSQHIHALEVELGVRLFDRRPRGVTLTDAGVALLGPARELLAGEATARSSVQRIAERSRSQVEIAAISSVCGGLIPEALRLLARTQPSLSVRLYERPARDALGLLSAQAAELAIVRDPPDDAGFDLDFLMAESLIIAVPASHPLAKNKTLPLATLRSEDFIFFDPSQGRTLYSTTIAACAAAGFVPRIRWEGPEIGSVGRFVAAGLGVAVMPRCAPRQWVEENICILELPEPRPMSTIYIATMPGRVLSAMATRVVAALHRVAARYNEPSLTIRPPATQRSRNAAT
jgi:DNA-binding transcriptional LysR family regulator